MTITNNRKWGHPKQRWSIQRMKQKYRPHGWRRKLYTGKGWYFWDEIA